MVAIARHLNVTLIVPELDKTSFWADPRHVNNLLSDFLVCYCLKIIFCLFFFGKIDINNPTFCSSAMNNPTI